MGNLRQSMTDQEWDDIERKEKEERSLGKPDTEMLYLSIYSMDLNILKKLRSCLSEFYSDYQLKTLDGWIYWRSKN